VAIQTNTGGYQIVAYLGRSPRRPARPKIGPPESP